MKINSDLQIGNTNKTLNDVRFKGDEEYILVGFATNTTIVNGTAQAPLNQVFDSVGNFTLNNKNIYIPAGVHKIRVSGNFAFEQPSGQSYVWTRAYLNTTSFSGSIIDFKGSIYYGNTSMPATIIDVQKGDYIKIQFDNAANTKIRTGKTSSWLLIEKVS